MRSWAFLNAGLYAIQDVTTVFVSMVLFLMPLPCREEVVPPGCADSGEVGLPISL